MEERSSHLTIVIGASTVAEELRRSLVQRGAFHAGVATHMRGLRRSMFAGETDLVILCIALDQSTLRRHGAAFRKLIADGHGFPQAVRTVGLLTEAGMTRDLAAIGCDVYTHDSAEAIRAIRQLANRWRTQRTRKAITRREPAPAGLNSVDAEPWMWRSAPLPVDFSFLHDSSPERLTANASTDRASKVQVPGVQHADDRSIDDRNPDALPDFD